MTIDRNHNLKGSKAAVVARRSADSSANLFPSLQLAVRRGLVRPFSQTHRN